jgi:5-(carboxyamino)imidazole ribonucleotide synthase
MSAAGPRSLGPGSTIGILGTGQLGRMLALVARRMGYRVATYGDGPSPTPTGQVADVEVVAAWDDEAALAGFLGAVDVATVEFENVPPAALDAAGLARPAGPVLAVCQRRDAEKRFLAAHGLPTVRFAEATGPDELRAFGLPAVAKTAAFGYDGKGQWLLRSSADLDAVPPGVGLVVEELVDLRAELSVIVARGHDGELRCHPPIENHHRNHVLDHSVAPARLGEAVTAEAVTHAERIAVALGLVGVLAVEFFLTTDGRLVVNELAPRPHNSGHLTIEACPTSQFEQQLRAITGMPLGAVTPFRAAAMANLLGDMWPADGREPDWAAALSRPGVSLHLYGKAEARPGRKMGHLTVVASTPDEALELVLDARRSLQP